VIGDFLDQTCNILLQNSAEPLQDAAGGLIRDPRTAAQDMVPCLVREVGADDSAVDGKASETKIVYVYFDPDDLQLAITTEHRIEVLRRPPLANRELVVTGSIDFNSMSELLRVECSEQTV
jgi:hypothetical protein